jgi:hypothetical protein
VEQVGWRNCYDDQAKDALRSEREQADGENHGWGTPRDLEVGSANVISSD